MATSGPGFDLSTLTAYVDETSFDLIAASVLGTNLAQNVNVRAGLKGNTVAIPIMSDDFTVGDGNSCGWNAPSSASIDQIEMCLHHAKIQHEFCTQALRETFMAQALAAGQFGSSENLPYEATFVNYFVEKLQNWNEKFLIDGKGTCTGFRQALSGSATEGASGAWSTTNALTGAYDMYSKLSGEVALADDLIMVLSPGDYKKLALNAVAENYFRTDFTPIANGSNFILPGTAIKVVACGGIKEQTGGIAGYNTRILTRASNLIMGTDLTGDFETFKMWYSEDNDQVRATMKWAIGAAAAEPTEGVISNSTRANYSL